MFRYPTKQALLGYHIDLKLSLNNSNFGLRTKVSRHSDKMDVRQTGRPASGMSRGTHIIKCLRN